VLRIEEEQQRGVFGILQAKKLKAQGVKSLRNKNFKHFNQVGY